MAFYGWISKVDNSKLRIGDAGNSGTKTGDYFIYFFEKEGAMKNSDIRSKNLYTKNGINYYILSIGENKSMWAPYPFITELDNLKLVLTQDTGEGEGVVWVIDKDKEKSELNSDEFYKFNGIKLKKQSRKVGGDYYSLSKRQLKDMREGHDEGKPDYAFDNSKPEESIEDVVKKILNQ